ncbi:hypothetical protein WME77_27490 [Sorangium sp. So ce764]|uniref:hypothetical protein n=1 Tax=Sorangium sp. So ce764 TaxID=3133320 RepID=UPI003F60F8AD
MSYPAAMGHITLSSAGGSVTITDEVSDATPLEGSDPVEIVVMEGSETMAVSPQTLRGMQLTDGTVIVVDEDTRERIQRRIENRSGRIDILIQEPGRPGDWRPTVVQSFSDVSTSRHDERQGDDDAPVYLSDDDSSVHRRGDEDDLLDGGWNGGGGWLRASEGDEEDEEEESSGQPRGSIDGSIFDHLVQDDAADSRGQPVRRQLTLDGDKGIGRLVLGTWNASHFGARKDIKNPGLLDIDDEEGFDEAIFDEAPSETEQDSYYSKRNKDKEIRGEGEKDAKAQYLVDMLVGAMQAGHAIDGLVIHEINNGEAFQEAFEDAARKAGIDGEYELHLGPRLHTGSDKHAQKERYPVVVRTAKLQVEGVEYIPTHSASEKGRPKVVAGEPVQTTDDDTVKTPSGKSRPLIAYTIKRKDRPSAKPLKLVNVHTKPGKGGLSTAAGVNDRRPVFAQVEPAYKHASKDDEHMWVFLGDHYLAGQDVVTSSGERFDESLPPGMLNLDPESKTNTIEKIHTDVENARWRYKTIKARRASEGAKNAVTKLSSTNTGKRKRGAKEPEKKPPSRATLKKKLKGIEKDLRSLENHDTRANAKKDIAALQRRLAALDTTLSQKKASLDDAQKKTLELNADTKEQVYQSLRAREQAFIQKQKSARRVTRAETRRDRARRLRDAAEGRDRARRLREAAEGKDRPEASALLAEADRLEEQAAAQEKAASGEDRQGAFLDRKRTMVADKAVVSSRFVVRKAALMTVLPGKRNEKPKTAFVEKDELYSRSGGGWEATGEHFALAQGRVLSDHGAMVIVVSDDPADQKAADEMMDALVLEPSGLAKTLDEAGDEPESEQEAASDFEPDSSDDEDSSDDDEDSSDDDDDDEDSSDDDEDGDDGNQDTDNQDDAGGDDAGGKEASGERSPPSKRKKLDNSSVGSLHSATMSRTAQRQSTPTRPTTTRTSITKQTNRPSKTAAKRKRR